MWQTCEYYSMLPCEELSWMCRLSSASELTALVVCHWHIKSCKTYNPFQVIFLVDWTGYS